MSHHPCGALPIWSWSPTVWYCGRHMAWFARCYSFVEHGQVETPTLLEHAVMEWGPFDDLTDVQAWLRVQWEAHLARVTQEEGGAGRG